MTSGKTTLASSAVSSVCVSAATSTTCAHSSIAMAFTWPAKGKMLHLLMLLV